MELSERLAELSEKVRQQRAIVATEEATKNALVMPFISTILGYDIFDPREVIPEFTADIGVKKGEKIDYAIVKDGKVQILIECKRSGPLTIEAASQLFRYFAVSDARIAILTNGETYQFYTDLDAPNRMDEKPFLILDLNDVDESAIPAIQKLTRDAFDLDSILSAAGELKYVGQIKRILSAQFKDPDDDWIRFFVSRIYDGTITARVREQFRPLVVKAARQFLTEQVNDRLKVAIGAGYGSDPEPETAPSPTDHQAEPSAGESEENLPVDAIQTTLEEMDGYHIVRAIACAVVKVSRVSPRDAQSYFAVLLDDNNRKPIARLHFNRKQKYLGTFDERKVETRHPIDTLDQIYDYADLIRATVRRYTEATADSSAAACATQASEGRDSSLAGTPG